MHVDPGSPRRAGEPRRYFPDWIDWLPDGLPELEADRNSYLAGGYAEEFGYWSQPGYSRGVLVLDGESPEHCAECHSQARATHPGYPIRAHPLSGNLEEIVDDRAARLARRDAVEWVDRSLEAERHGTFFDVSKRSYERERKQGARRTGVLSTRFAAVLVSLRWSLGRWH